MATGLNSCISGAKRKILSEVLSCMYCGATSDLCIDHIFPPSRGGNSDLVNLTRSCVSCNSMKNCMTVEEWQNRIEELVSKKEADLTRLKNILHSLQSESYKLVLDAK